MTASLTAARDAPPAQPPAPRSGGLTRRTGRYGLIFLAPAIAFFALLFYYPMVKQLWISFFTGPYADQWVGLANYTRAFTDPAVRHSFLVTLAFAVLVMVPAILGGLALALLVNLPLRGLVVFRTLILVPYVTSIVIVGLLWKNILDPQVGILNAVLRDLGLPPQNFLAEQPLLTIAAVTVWQALGYNMVLFLAGLQGIPATYLEAARVDGASAWQRFVRITVPLLAPTTVFVSIMAVISSLQAFGQAYVITGGGPANATDLFVFHVFSVAFDFRDLGYSAALSFLMFGLILCLTIAQLALNRRAER
ncbi:binding-protein-dependent transport systems inner membrane component [Beutenbergia cavernae DSM 12333]|uniref:Binding-protein-dependent transport systems inner membrane component n=1 Tax=Beutenbergia cavernae (strain ATCC BAA-8 / DSM 12333 / CCUG 43141 / JCM 11478 / NBRC 16432 / NCIMB 13614 / HKI 0122) TaxID=471853 RepID=C5BXG4_BEUC1|nr:sugar ABC transporter permease [Beutenbergia cavernae]ACQ80847.1 binding-protein-dependent transport systems inner membrane component [Beutenbergia cavernae DSM 12333]